MAIKVARMPSTAGLSLKTRSVGGAPKKPSSFWELSKTKFSKGSIIFVSPKSIRNEKKRSMAAFFVSQTLGVNRSNTDCLKFFRCENRSQKSVIRIPLAKNGKKKIELALKKKERK